MWIENIVEKGENAGIQHFLLSPQCFQKPFQLSEYMLTMFRYELKCPFSVGKKSPSPPSQF